MINSIFDSNMIKKIDNIAQKQAKLDEKKRLLVKESLLKLDAETLNGVFNVVGEYGHPNEKEVVKNIKQKYESGKGLEFDDLKNIDDLYKSNIEKFSNKKDD